MKKTRLTYAVSLFILGICFIGSCTNSNYVPNHDKIEDGFVNYQVNTTDIRQEIDNFGASDAWVFQYIGKNWPIEKRNRLADLLFSQEVDAAGNPKGIGLSLWRICFGAGSKENPAPGHAHAWQSMWCARDANGVYDLGINGKLGGKVWMAQAAKERGCDQFLGFCNGPPYYWTNSGYPTGAGSEWEDKFHLKLDHVDDYAEYISEIIRRMKTENDIDLGYFSPVNEPEYHTRGGEGCRSNNSEIAMLAKAINNQFTTDGVTTKITLAESGQIQLMYGDGGGGPDFETYGWKAEDLFSAESPDYMGNLSNVAKLISYHAYWSERSDSELVDTRELAAAEMLKYGIKYWQTEYCIMSQYHTNPDGSGVAGPGRDVGMNAALHVARVIHADFTIANVSAWHWWLGATAVNYKDGLIYLLDKGADLNSSGTSAIYSDGDIVETKLLWAFGNFSRFIRPGAVRLGVTSKSDVSDIRGIMCSAYKNKDGKYVYVMVNSGEKEDTITLNTSDEESRTFTPYITSDVEGDNLRPMTNIKSDEKFVIPAKSIVTFNEI